MKTILEINSNNYASTGNIMLNIAKQARTKGYKVYTCCRKSRAGLKLKYEDQIYIGTWLDRVISERLSYFFGLNGCFNIINTLLFIRKIKKIKPDLIHLHSLCDNYLNISIFFRFLKKLNIPVIWTLHDIWPFTGRCAKSVCDKWKQGCGNCPHLDLSPESLFLDNTRYIWKKREKLYNDLSTLTIVTPSKWLADLTRISLFKENHPIKVINNGINLDIFKPTKSTFRKDHNIEKKHMILGVANYWNDRKGINELIRLSEELPDDYVIVIVGSVDFIGRELPDNIIHIKKTSDVKELVEIYSAADLFVNPTIDDNFPTVNMEAIACGCPILTYNTGGSAEIIDKKSGLSIKQNDYEMLKKEIIRICKTKPYKKQDCLKRASKFNMEDKFNEYIKLFDEILNKTTS